MSLAERSLQAISSNYVGTVVRVAAQLVAQVVIMRELGPEMVGVFGYTLLLYGVLALIIDQGFGWSLVQGDFNDEREISTVFTRIMFASLLATLGVAALSYPISAYLGSQLVGEVIRYSAPAYLLMGLFIVSQAKLRAELRFGAIQKVVTGSYLIAYPVVGVCMALAGFGVWALLGAWYTQALLQAIAIRHYSPHSFRLANPFRTTTTGLLGRRVAGINIVSWAVDNSSGVFVGGQGAAMLGNFNAASMLARTPATQLVQTLQSVLFSTASALANDQQKIKRLYLGALAGIGFVVLPAYGYAAGHADLVVGLVFGQKYQEAAALFSVLSIGMVAMAVGTLSSSILTATGGQQSVLNSQLVCLGLMLAGLLLAVNVSLFYVGLAMSLAYVIRLTMQLLVIGARAGVTVVEMWSTVKGPFLITLLMIVPIAIPGPVHLGLRIGDFLDLVVKVAAAVFLVIAFPRFFLSSPFVDVLGRFGVGRRVLGRLRL